MPYCSKARVHNLALMVPSQTLLIPCAVMFPHTITDVLELCADGPFLLSPGRYINY